MNEMQSADPRLGLRTGCRGQYLIVGPITEPYALPAPPTPRALSPLSPPQ
jgi:hypothetical protein